MDSKPVSLYAYPASGPCFFAQLTMDHLGVKYEYKETMPTIDTRKEEFLKRNPQGKIPFIEEDDFSLGESHAISRYVSCLIISLQFAKRSTDPYFYPYDDAKKVAKIDALIDFDVQTIKKPFYAYGSETVIGPKLQGKETPTDERKKELQKDIDEVLRQLNDILERNGGDFVNGEHLTLADFALFSSSLYGIVISDADYSKYDRVKQWWDRVAALPVVDHLLMQHKESFKNVLEQFGKQKNQLVIPKIPSYYSKKYTIFENTQ